MQRNVDHQNSNSQPQRRAGRNVRIATLAMRVAARGYGSIRLCSGDADPNDIYPHSAAISHTGRDVDADSCRDSTGDIIGCASYCHP